MRRFFGASLVALLCVACSAGPEEALLGHWTGGFVADKGQDHGNYGGFLHLYQSQRLFKMELRGRYQTLTATGDWTVEKDRITLRTKDLQSDQPNDDEIAALKSYFLEVDEVRKELGHETVLKSQNGLLQGLQMHLGKVEGHLEFKHAARGAFEGS